MISIRKDIRDRRTLGKDDIERLLREAVFRAEEAPKAIPLTPGKPAIIH